MQQTDTNEPPVPLETTIDERRLAILPLAKYSVIIDARTPLEYADDHVPGAVNLPVVEQQEFAEVGTLHRRDPHRAYVVGAAYALRCIAGHIETVVSAYKPTDHILVYCFRGGKRSRLWGDILRAIGFNVDVLSGGWKAYRQWVASGLERLIPTLRFHVIAGSTGSGKTRLLKALEAKGAQVLDLEAIAGHRGSVLGAVPGLAQPSQKRFESLLFDRLRKFSSDQVVWVESESRMIGRIHLPRSLYEAICAAPASVLSASLDDRVLLLHEDYRHLLADLHGMVDKLQHIAAEVVGRKEIIEWRTLADQCDSRELFRRMMERYYDPLYARASRKNLRMLEVANRVSMPALDDGCVRAVAEQLIARERGLLG